MRMKCFSEHNLQLVFQLMWDCNVVHAPTSKYTMTSISEQKCRKLLKMWGDFQSLKGQCPDFCDRYRLLNFSVYYIFTVESGDKR